MTTTIQTDLAVVGGGPAGLLSAISASRGDVEVTLLDSKSRIGQIEHCAGLLSIEGLETLDLKKLPEEVLQNKSIIGGKIYSPEGKELIVRKKTPHAYVVDRSKFNAYLGEIARDEGVNIINSSQVRRITRNEGILNLHYGKLKNLQSLSTKMVVLAEGRYPKLNQQIGLPSPQKKDIIYAAQYIFSNVKDLDMELVELYQTTKYSPGFFTWIIPIDDKSAKVGLGTRYKPASRYLQTFIKHNDLVKDRFAHSTITKKMSGAIPLGSFIKKTYTDNVLIVGDAAGQTKPTTGGGVILGGIAAQIAGEISLKAIEEGDYSSRFLSTYEKKWKKEFKWNITIMKLIRRYLDSMKESDIDKLFDLLNKQKIKKIFTNFGDIDNQAKIVLKLLSVFRLWPFIARTGLLFLLGRDSVSSFES